MTRVAPVRTLFLLPEVCALWTNSKRCASSRVWTTALSSESVFPSPIESARRPEGVGSGFKSCFEDWSPESLEKVSAFYKRCGPLYRSQNLFASMCCTRAVVVDCAVSFERINLSASCWWLEKSEQVCMASMAQCGKQLTLEEEFQSPWSAAILCCFEKNQESLVASSILLTRSSESLTRIGDFWQIY